MFDRFSEEHIQMITIGIWLALTLITSFILTIFIFLRSCFSGLLKILVLYLNASKKFITAVVNSFRQMSLEQYEQYFIVLQQFLRNNILNTKNYNIPALEVSTNLLYVVPLPIFRLVFFNSTETVFDYYTVCYLELSMHNFRYKVYSNWIEWLTSYWFIASTEDECLI